MLSFTAVWESEPSPRLGVWDEVAEEEEEEEEEEEVAGRPVRRSSTGCVCACGGSRANELPHSLPRNVWRYLWLFLGLQ